MRWAQVQNDAKISLAALKIFFCRSHLSLYDVHDLYRILACYY